MLSFEMGGARAACLISPDRPWSLRCHLSQALLSTSREDHQLKLAAGLSSFMSHEKTARSFPICRQSLKLEQPGHVSRSTDSSTTGCLADEYPKISRIVHCCVRQSEQCASRTGDLDLVLLQLPVIKFEQKTVQVVVTVLLSNLRRETTSRNGFRWRWFQVLQRPC
jgi:hypothetical protein